MTQRFGNSSRWAEKGEGNKRGERSFFAPTLIPRQSTGRESLSTLELECLSFTHQTICFIRFIFTPSDPVQPDKALMMKRRGHPCIISELACRKVGVCARARVRAHARAAPQQYNFGQARAQTAMPAHRLILTICSAPRTGVTPHFFFPSSASLLCFSHTPVFPQHLKNQCPRNERRKKKKVIKSETDSLNCYNSL